MLDRKSLFYTFKFAFITIISCILVLILGLYLGNYLKSKNILYIALGCSIMIYFALYSLTDYSINGDCAVFIGLIIATQLQNKQNTTIKV